MNEIEKIRRYIEKTGVKYPNGTSYQMHLSEMLALTSVASDCLVDAICIAFDYGRAKGERHAKEKVKKAVSV